MISAPLHPKEADRLKALRDLGLLNTGPEEMFDELTALAAQICETPIALVSLVEENAQCFKSRVGLEATETPRDVAFCAHAILGDVPFVVSDALADERFCDNPLVTGAPHVRFYAGVPIVSPNGYPIGTLCVIDGRARSISDSQLSGLKALAHQVSRLLVLKLKIVELEAAQTVLKTQEQESRAILDGVPSFIGHWSTDLHLLNCNAAYETLFGNLSKTKGQHASVVLGDELYRKNVPHIEKALAGIPVHFEREIVKPDGSLTYALISFVPNVVDGKVASFFSISTDITGVKQSENARRALESKLVNSDRLSVLGEIACGVAHEIKNPLAIIVGKLVVLRMQLEAGAPNPTQMLDAVTKLEATVERITKIVRGLQTYSRKSDSDPMLLTPLAAIINDSLALCLERLKRDEVELSLDCPPELQVLCHPSEISQVFINLVMNALDAISERSPKWIRIGARDLGTHIEVRVTDCGPGIPADVAAKLMDAFFTTKSVGKGTGLGLSISKTIIENHGGTLTLDASAPNTTFVVTLKT